MKNWLATLCVALVFLLSQTTVLAQVKQGYIVTSKPDTVRGQINFGDWDKIPTFIEFKADTAADYRKLSVKDITAFGIPDANQLYVSRQATILQVGSFTYATIPKTVEHVHVFMQVLVKGARASVYQMRDGSDNGRFFVEKDSSLMELVNQPYSRVKNDRTYYVPGDLYREQLSNICSDTESFRAANTPEYTEASMRRYFQRYNACFMGETITYTAPEQRMELRTAAVAGVEMLTRMPYGVVRPTVGASLRLSLPRRNYNRFLKLDWLVTPSIPVDLGSHWEPKNVRRTLHLVEFTVGTYLGHRAIRPFIHANVSMPLLRGTDAGGFGWFLGGGISYKRKVDLEIGHPMVLPIYAIFISSKEDLKYLFTPPRIAVHYYFK